MASREFKTVLDKIVRWTNFLNALELEFDIKRIRDDASKAVAHREKQLRDRIFDIDGIQACWCCDTDSSPDNRILYLHGGGYVAGSIPNHAHIAELISKVTGCSVLLISYSLSPEFPFPAALNESVKAFQWIRKNGPVKKSNPNKLFMVGDSAGGGLALSTLLKLRDIDSELPDSAVVLSPFTDLSLEGKSLDSRKDSDPVITPEFLKFCSEAYSGGQDVKFPYISPVYSDPTGLPPILIQVGDAEVLLDDSIRFSQNAKDAGVDVTLEVWPEMFHSWQSYSPAFPEATEAVEKIGQYIKSFI